MGPRMWDLQCPVRLPWQHGSPAAPWLPAVWAVWDCPHHASHPHHAAHWPAETVYDPLRLRRPLAAGRPRLHSGLRCAWPQQCPRAKRLKPGARLSWPTAPQPTSQRGKVVLKGTSCMPPSSFGCAAAFAAVSLSAQRCMAQGSEACCAGLACGRGMALAAAKERPPARWPSSHR